MNPLTRNLGLSSLTKVTMKKKSKYNFNNLMKKYPEYLTTPKMLEILIIAHSKTLKSTLPKNKALLLMKNKLKKNSIKNLKTSKPKETKMLIIFKTIEILEEKKICSFN
jgi:hypothetical protein